MQFNFPPFAIIFFLGGALALSFAFATYLRRPAPGVVLFALFAVACCLWTFAGGLETGAADYSTKIFWSKVEAIGAVSSGALWLSFSLDYSGSDWWHRPRNFLLLWIIPVITVIIVWTNELHHWAWTQIYPAPGSSGSILIYSHGPWFWVFVVYAYIVYFLGFGILLRFMRKKPNSRSQIIILLIGTLIPIAGSIIYVLGLTPIAGLDLIPSTFIVAGVIYAVTIFRFHFPDVIPVARSILVENLPDGILVLDAGGEIVDINPSVGQMKGINTRLALGKRLEQVWPELDKIRTNIESGKQAELVIETSGENLYLDVSVTPLKRKRNCIAGQLIVLRDISERKTTHRKLEFLFNEEHLLRHSLQDEIDKRSKYTRTLVHELKTPLTAILASIELLETEIHDNLLLAMVKNIQRSSLNLELRINELIELARGELGVLKINPVPLEMGQLLQEIVSEMSPVAISKGLFLVSDIPELPLVLGDKERLRQVMSNLISNALKFTSKGIVSITACKCDSDTVLVQVKDTGKGLEKEETENLFDPYRRKTRDGQQSGGLGIGLALSKMLVDLHRGKIWVESIPGSGSTFSFTVPIHKV